MSDDHDLLIRIDERTEATHTDVEKIKKVLDHLPQRYVTRPEFKPVRAVVYGLVGMILTGAIFGILAASFGVMG